jgi:hypothetical protein
VRIALSKSIRFEVFKRDAFTCQYCGRKAPDVLLEVDHVEPVSQGGTNDLLNLVSACRDCNAGKSDRRLSDTSRLDAQRRQLEELQDRREQIDLMFQWQRELSSLDEDVALRISEFWQKVVPGYSLNSQGMQDMKALSKKYSLDEVLAAMQCAADQYLVFEGDEPTKESVELAWSKVSGICRNKRADKDDPQLKRLFYIRGIVRNRFSYCNERVALALLQDARARDASIDGLERFAKSAKNWTEWRAGMNDYIAQCDVEDGDTSGEGLG